ncbi:MAG: GGDEF domain-containing protein, partial [Burkholderiales bacterium]|nr:GGDEF domain-containing protein [Burkholderiales bacterium]
MSGLHKLIGTLAHLQRLAVRMLFSCLAFLVAALPAIAANPPSVKEDARPILGAPFITNYYPKIYKGHSQNWVSVQDRRGVMYFGNSTGILEFDGQRWQNIAVAGNPMVRSLTIAPDGTIYYGSIGDFGYLKETPSGKIEALSLKPLLAKDEPVFNDVWQVESTIDGIVFMTRSRLFRYHDGKLSSIAGRFASSQAAVLNGNLIYVDSDKGISLLDGDQVLPIPQLAGMFTGKRVMLTVTGQHELLLGRLNGDFRFVNLSELWDAQARRYRLERQANKVLEVFNTELDGQLSEDKMYLYKLVAIDQDHFALSSVKAGIVIFNRRGQVVRAINKNAGLIDNTVAGIMVDRARNLWASSNSGIAHIELSVPQSLFTAKNGIEGVSITSTVYRGRLYVGTFQDVLVQSAYRYDPKHDAPQFVPLREGPNEVWQFMEVRGDLMASSGRGLYKIHGDTATRIIGSSGNAYCLGVTSKWPEYLFVGLMGGVEVFRQRDGVWTLVGKMEGVKDNIRRITADAQGDLWLNTEALGLLRVHFNGTTPLQVATHRIGLEHGMPELSGSRTKLLGDDLLLMTPKGLYQARIAPWLDGVIDATRFVPDARFGEMFSDGSRELSEIAPEADNDVYLKTNEGIYLARRDAQGRYQVDGRPFKGVEAPDETLLVHPDGGVYLPGESLIRVEPDALKDYSQSFTSLIRRVSTQGKLAVFEGGMAQQSIQNPTQNDVRTPSYIALHGPQFGYEKNALSFEFSASFYEKPGSLRFQYQLEGFDRAWSEWDTATIKEYTNIPEGQYRFKVRAQNLYGIQSDEASYQFEILPPWYRSWWAMICWLLLVAVSMWIIAHFYSSRLRREKLRLEELVAKRTQQLRDVSLTDPLTGLRNRRFISEVLHNDIAAFVGYKNYLVHSANNRAGFTGREVFGLFLLDMDHFKLVNDTYGHEAGDLVLRQFAAILTETVRKDDVVVRLGGEEFLVVLKKTEPDFVHTFAKRLLEKVSLHQFDLGDGVRIHKTCSIG